MLTCQRENPSIDKTAGNLQETLTFGGNKDDQRWLIAYFFANILNKTNPLSAPGKSNIAIERFLFLLVRFT